MFDKRCVGQMTVNPKDYDPMTSCRPNIMLDNQSLRWPKVASDKWFWAKCPGTTFFYSSLKPVSTNLFRLFIVGASINKCVCVREREREFMHLSVMACVCVCVFTIKGWRARERERNACDVAQRGLECNDLVK